MSSFTTAHLCACLSLLSLASAQSYSHTPAASAPTGASTPVAASFAGFGIEPSNLYSFTGHDEVNQLSVNLLNNLANMTGTPPHLRIGGNTQDDMEYQTDYTDFYLETNPNPTVSSAAYPPDEWIFGPAYFTAIDRFPANTPITFGLNLAYEGDDYATRINNTAYAAVNNLKNVDLVSFEIGNEVDLYLENGFRTGTWDGATYTEQWLDRANIVYTNVLEPAGLGIDFFEPGCTASTIGTTFTIGLLTEDGIADDRNGTSTPYVAQWNQHDYYYYIGVSTYTLTLDLFTELSTTATQFASWTQQISAATSNGYRYALREMGVVGPIGEHGITDIFAASLWTLNFFLYAASLNISSVQMHMTDNSNASAWQPILMYGNEPFVRPNYYAWAAFDQLIGCGGGVQIAGPGVVSTGAPSGYTNRIAVYDSYRDSKLASIVIINTNVANASETSKPSVTFDLSLPDFEGQTLYLSYLTADGADSYYNTTWNGISYEVSGDGTPTTTNSTVQTVKVASGGAASVSVRDSQAVIVNIGKVIGDNGDGTTTCSVITRTKSSSATASATTSSSTNATSTATNSSSQSSTNSSSSSSPTKSSAASPRMVTAFDFQTSASFLIVPILAFFGGVALII